MMKVTKPWQNPMFGENQKIVFAENKKT